MEPGMGTDRCLNPPTRTVTTPLCAPEHWMFRSPPACLVTTFTSQWTHISFAAAISLQHAAVPTRPRRLCASRHIRALRHFALKLALVLIPSFLQSKDELKKRLGPTAFLDGLRGLAAFFVFHQHLLQPHTTETFKGYGHDGVYYWIQFPILRLFYAGATMVFIFFVVSGYALSYALLKARRDHGWQALLPALSSSTFRRGIRLYLPAMVVSFVFMSLVYLGLCEPVRHFAAEAPGWPDAFPIRKASYYIQVQHWVWMWQEMMNFSSWAIYWPTYDDHLWTIRTEFMGSLVLYLIQLLLARVKAMLRVVLLIFFMLYCMIYGRWEIWMFLGGMTVAEVDILRGTDKCSSPPQPSATRPNYRYKITITGLLWTTNLLVALYLLSMPMNNASTTPGYVWLDSLIPSSWVEERFGFWWGFGSIQLLATASNCPLVAKAFTNRFAQYLGKISYALYVVHGPLLLTMGYAVSQALTPILGGTSTFSWTIAIVVEWLVLMPVLFFISDIVWRLVDQPSVSLARWLQSKCFTS
ncbi:hypothetical protein ANO11243_063460 [Dothideomycetidae sp. 11243]|nr:hypothetical protein ANO11243_063460 [fungal sp. No.11243]